MMAYASSSYQRPKKLCNQVSQVTHVYHATHIHTAVEMLKSFEWEESSAKCEVEITAFPNMEKQQLIHFGCQLGQAWKPNRNDANGSYEDTSRYGNVEFEFDLDHVFRAYSKFFDDKIVFLAGGTTPYKREYSHKVFVSHETGFRGSPLLNNQEEDLPLYHDETGCWWVSDIGQLESMEFALHFGTVVACQKPPSITLHGKMRFISHRDICVPLTKMENKYATSPLSERFFLDSEDLPCRVLCTDGNYSNGERAKTSQALTEFAAAILWFERSDLFPFLRESGLIQLLAGTMKKIANRNNSEQATERTSYQKKYYPKHWFANRLYEKYCLGRTPDDLQEILENLCNVLAPVIGEEQVVEQAAMALVLPEMDRSVLNVPTILESLCQRMSRFPDKKYEKRENHPTFLLGRDRPTSWYTYECYEQYCYRQPKDAWLQILLQAKENIMMTPALTANAEDQNLQLSQGPSA